MTVARSLNAEIADVALRLAQRRAHLRRDSCAVQAHIRRLLLTRQVLVWALGAAWVLGCFQHKR